MLASGLDDMGLPECSQSATLCQTVNVSMTLADKTLVRHTRGLILWKSDWTLLVPRVHDTRSCFALI